MELKFDYKPNKNNLIIGLNGSGKTQFLKYLNEVMNVSKFTQDNIDDVLTLVNSILEDKPFDNRLLSCYYFIDQLERVDMTKYKQYFDDDLKTLLATEYKIELTNETFEDDIKNLSWGQRNICLMIFETCIANTLATMHNQPMTILIDMPELGLHLEYQEHIMETLVKLVNTELVHFTVVTHSPEVYNICNNPYISMDEQFNAIDFS